MPHVKEMNDWQEYQQQLKKDMDRQVTSNKALLWVGIAINGVFTLIAFTTALVALVHSMMLGRDNLALQKEVAACQTQIKASIQTVEDTALQAKRAYDNARQYERRHRSQRHTEDEIDTSL